LIPSLLLVQLFRRIQQRHTGQEKLAAIYETIKRTKESKVDDARARKHERCQLVLPWWCIFVAYSLSFVIMGVSILFVIARGIEFGDVKTQQWLLSLVIGFFSSVFLTQPLKVNRAIEHAVRCPCRTSA
jgi:hypothetical protein